ncbi:hypothetical protein [Candidatus Hepatobacter penaei]|uniref:hypothetical protein n=1 Tax=Candidatus Hepatobacter penaei TaxID=1274402 RepID=UPI0004F265E5|nr:hypothetical protein [Candidatus Hepatobacter penaei]
MAILLWITFPALGIAEETKLENRNPSVGKVHIQNHAVVDKAPFFLLKPFRVMVLSDKGPIAILRADVIVETHDETSKKKLEKFLPRIYSRLLEDFYGLAYLLWGSGYHPDLMSIKNRTERLVRKEVHEDLVRDVFVQKVFIKPMPPVRNDKAF